MTLEIPLAEIARYVGEELGVSDWHRVSQEQINEFAKVTGDHQWVHVDIPRATRERGGTIAHGLLTLSLLPMLANQICVVTDYGGGFNYGYDRLRFTSPVKTGSRVRLRQTLKDVSEKKGGQMVTIASVVEIEGQDHPALVADWQTLYFPA